VLRRGDREPSRASIRAVRETVKHEVPGRIGGLWVPNMSSGAIHPDFFGVSVQTRLGLLPFLDLGLVRVLEHAHVVRRENGEPSSVAQQSGDGTLPAQRGGRSAGLPAQRAW